MSNKFSRTIKSAGIMSNVGDAASSGQWEQISAHKFEINEDMIMTFEGTSCNIQDSERRLVESLGSGDGRVTRDVLAGYRCYVIKASVKFEKKSS